MPNIQVSVKLFAIYQEAYKENEITLALPPQSPARDVLEEIITKYPHLDKWRSVTRFGVNLQFVSPETILEDGDEVVLIPPVSGG